MSRRNSLEAKRARRAQREEIVSGRLRKQRAVIEDAERFVSERIKEAKERARAHLESLTVDEVRAEVEQARERGAELPPKSKLRSKRAMIEALVPSSEEDIKSIFETDEQMLQAARSLS